MADIRIEADVGLVYAYCEASGYALSDVVRQFNVKQLTRKDTCKMEYRTKTLGWQCSACGRITRGYESAPFNYCPNCGAARET